MPASEGRVGVELTSMRLVQIRSGMAPIAGIVGWGLHGAIVAVAIAWGCALWSAPAAGLDEPPGPAGRAVFARAFGEELPLDALRGYWSESVGLVEGYVADRRAPRGVARSVRVTRAGWPLRCLIGERRFDGDTPTFVAALGPESFPMLQAATRRPLPMRPRVVALLVNAAVFGLASWLLAMVPAMVRGRWREARGRCPSCGYDRRGLGVRCSECGQVFRSR